MVPIRTFCLPQRCLSVSLSLSRKYVPYPTSSKTGTEVRNRSLRTSRVPISTSAKVDHVELTQTVIQEKLIPQKQQSDKLKERGCHEEDVERSTDTIKNDNDAEVSNKEDPGLHLREFMSNIVEVASDFEFFLLPYQAKATLLFRPKYSHDEWAPLVVRTNECASPPRFGRVRQSSDLLGWDVKTKQLYFFPRHSVGSVTTITLAAASRYRIDNMNEALARSWATQSKRLRLHWLREAMFDSRWHKAWMESVNRVWSMLYDPLDLSVAFSFLGADSILSLNGVPIFQKKISTKRRLQQRVVTIKTRRSGQEVPLAADSNVELFIFGFHDVRSLQLCGPLVGVYIFPKHVLREQGYLSDIEMNIRGRIDITLYPPGSEPKYKPAKEKALWQNKFYHDLSTEPGSEQARQTLMQYLNEAKQKQCVPSPKSD